MQVLAEQGYEIDSITTNSERSPRPISRVCAASTSSKQAKQHPTSDYHLARHRQNCMQCQAEVYGLEKIASHATGPDSFIAIDTPGSAVMIKVTFSIDGMTCASCVGTITSALDQVAWVQTADINLLTGSASILIHGDHHVEELKEIIEDLGYDAAIQNVQQLPQEEVVPDPKHLTDTQHPRRALDLMVTGMYCHHCPSKVESSLGPLLQLGLVIEKRPTFDNPTMTVSYIPRPPDLTVRAIIGCVAAVDQALGIEIIHPPTIEERARLMHAREQQRLLLRLVLAGIIAIPTLVIGIVYMNLVAETDSVRMYLMRKLHGVSHAEWALFILATPVYLFAADVFHRRAIKELRNLWHPRSRIPVWRRFLRFGSMSTLLSLGTTIAYSSSIAELSIAAGLNSAEPMDNISYSYFDSVVFLTFFLLMGRLIEAYSKTKAGDAVAALGKLRPTDALLVTSGLEEQKVGIDLLDVGDHVRVPNGGSPPCDGMIMSGNAIMDESSLTGESRPVLKSVGDEVFAGTINNGTPLVIRITGSAGNSMLDQIITAVRDGQTKRAPVERVVDTWTGYFVPAVTLIAIMTWVVWLSLGSSGTLPDSYRDNPTGGWAFWSLQFAIAVFVIACPCGIGLAAPTALFVGGGLAAKHGILAKGGGEAFQEASQLDCVVFDKTGTLTIGGEPRVTDFMHKAGTVSESLLLSAILALEATSTHPIAKALVTLCKERFATTADVLAVDELPGKGLLGTIASSPPLEVLIGNEALLSSYGVPLSTAHYQTLTLWSSQAKSIALIATRSPTHPFTLTAMASISDPLRPEAASVITSLHSLNITTYLLTGDNLLTARAIGASLSIPESNIIASVLPHQKAAHIARIRAQLPSRRADRSRATVAMVGDGINDAPSLAAADVAIAIGSGSDVAISAAHFVLVRSHLGTLLTLIRLSRSVFRRVKWNFAWAVAYNLLAMPVAAGVLYPVVVGGRHVRLDPVWAAVAMAGSSLSVVGSSLALRLKVPGIGFRG
ncbi:Copper-transporting ATPase ccc2 [Sphaceloma murrayae]|uniref:Copper-transporting ATPase ccc2 n=1 Tax=Sphaceloma murrayae TaxID=2082308 RepID=A0A2K1R0T8_9PEZI|nr:Copper-transporting ATPase ccc2 [Sphaceloma murrayae]